MTRPAPRIDSARTAAATARALESPADVARFEALAPGSALIRAFMETPEWRAIRERIMGDGTPPLGRPESLFDVARLMRWSADGIFSEEPISAEARSAYLHAAREIEAFARTTATRTISPVAAPSISLADAAA